MIRIVKGRYGYRQKNGEVILIDQRYEPIELDPKEEERLVAKEVAVYVEKPKKTRRSKR